ncbi:MAG: hypothetical protein QOG10_204 [Kribbellaceae bacterium]|nr:hypothetical protein [Kribbellaceae bacterium]
MDQTKTQAPAGKPAKKAEAAWHRHPALIAGIPAVGAIIGSVITIVLGQAGALPASINPAPPPTTVQAVQTQTATSTVTERITETPTGTPTTESPSPTLETPPPGALAITIRISTGGKIGPNEYRAGSTPGANAEVYDETGRYLSAGCYPTWVLKRGTTVIMTGRNESCRGSFYFTTDSLTIRGVYHLTVSVVTDAGPKGTRTSDFKVT